MIGISIEYLTLTQSPTTERKEASNRSSSAAKNWLFYNTAKGVRASSVIYSVIETAKENGLNPYEYLQHLFTVMPDIPKKRYKELLPWSKSLPDGCRRKTAAGGGTHELQASEQPQG